MLRRIFQYGYICMIVYCILNYVYDVNRIESMTNNKVLDMTNRNAGSIQQIKEEMDAIRKSFMELLPLKKDVNLNMEVLNNLKTNAAARKAQAGASK